MISYIVQLVSKKRAESGRSIRKILKNKNSSRGVRDVTRKKLEIVDAERDSHDGHVRMDELSIEKKVSFFEFKANEGGLQAEKKPKKDKKKKSSHKKKKKKKGKKD